MQFCYPSSDSSWLKAVEDRRFYHFGSILCAVLKLAVALWKDVDSTQCLSCWNKNQTHKAAESDSSVQKQGGKGISLWLI